MGQLHRVSVGKLLDINISRAPKRPVAAEERKHTSVGRQGRSSRGIREIGDLNKRGKGLGNWTAYRRNEQRHAADKGGIENQQQAASGAGRWRLDQLGRRYGDARNLDGRSRHHCGEDVSAAGNRTDQLLRLVIERTADLEEALCQGVVGDRGVAPNRANELGFCHQVAVPLHQVTKYLERFSS